jgi:hypothetical protein
VGRVDLKDANPKTFRQAILGVIAAAGERGVTPVLLHELRFEPWRRAELDARLATYVRQGLIQRRTDELGRVTFHATAALADERNRWPVRRTRDGRRDEA